MTCLYVAVDAEPPAYPAVVLRTPFTLSNTACVPQKQPPAKTAVARPADAARGASTVGAGIGPAALAPNANIESANPSPKRTRISMGTSSSKDGGPGES